MRAEITNGRPPSRFRAGLTAVTAVTAVAAFAVACVPGPPPDSESDVAARDTAADRAEAEATYFEGSRRLWEDARERGILFRAVGQEPGWILDIDAETMLLSADYGARRVSMPAPEPVTDAAAGTTVYHATSAEHDLRVTIRDVACTDAMSGEQFSSTVAAVLDGTEYNGCGRRLKDLP